MATKKKVQATNKGGRPTAYDPKFVAIAGRLCSEKGYTDKNLAAHFKVSESTINSWKSRFPEFLESLKKGKDEFDSQVVEQSLLKSATGYIYVETTREPSKGDEFGEGGEADTQTLMVTKTVRKHISGDVTAQIFWLKNRKPARWSDKKEIDHRVAIDDELSDEDIFQILKRAREVGNGLDTNGVEGGKSSKNKKPKG